MKKYWEAKFKAEGNMWDYLPSDSAIKRAVIDKSM
jgi:hypothetical protein